MTERKLKDAPVLDVRELFSDHYKIKVDPVVDGCRKIDPMYFIVPCKYGEIYPFGGAELAVMVTAIRVANEMRGWPELQVHQDGDDAVVFRFRVDHFQKVAARVGARKKRRISDEHLRKLQSAGTAARKSEFKASLQDRSERQNQRSEVKA